MWSITNKPSAPKHPPPAAVRSYPPLTKGKQAPSIAQISFRPPYRQSPTTMNGAQ